MEIVPVKNKTAEWRAGFSHRFPIWMRKAVFVVAFAWIAWLGAALCVGTLGRATYRWHGFALEVRLLPSQTGETRLVLTPLGEVKARTHAAPLALVVSLQEIQIDEIRKLLTPSVKPEALARDFERTAHADLSNFILRQVVLAAVGGLLAPLLLHRRRFRAYIAGSGLGVLALSVLLGSALLTFNGKAFATPIYTGALRQAPWVIQFGKDAFIKIEALSQRLRTVASNLNVLYGRIEALPDRLADGSEAGTFRILHVSDLHNNTAALDFIREVADQFKVRFIVDTGDLTDFGSPPETVMVEGISKLPYPYVFVLGNHDSQTVASALSRKPNVILLNGAVKTVDGMTLLGLPNPASARAGVGDVVSTPQELQAGGKALLETVNTLPTPPDIVAIHDPEEAQALWGHVPLILCGHDHRIYTQTQTQPPAGITIPAGTPPPCFATIICNAGTTGAAGLRYFEKERGVPFSCAVLTFHEVPHNSQNGAVPAPSKASAARVAQMRPELAAITFISLDGTLQEYTVTQHLFNTTPASASSSPVSISPAPVR